MPKIWQNLKNTNDWLTHSQTWIQEMLAHLKTWINQWLWTYSVHTLKICWRFDKISKTWKTHSPTWIQEMLAHLKMFDKDLKKIWQRFNKPWAGIDIIMLVRLTILKMLTMLTMLMILTTNLDNKSWQQILTANLDDRFWQPISWIDCWLPYSALFRVTSATIFT